MARESYFKQEQDMLFEILQNSNTAISSGGGSGVLPSYFPNSKNSKFTPSQLEAFKALDHPDKNLIIQGWDTPPSFWGVGIKPATIYAQISFNNDIRVEILPILNSQEYKKNYTKGHRMLALVYIIKEGYSKGSKSYKTKNPGNIGNTDDGKINPQPTLKDGIKLLMDYFLERANGTKKGWEFGPREIKPTFSEEIQSNLSNYQRPNGFLPGYKGDYNGEIGYFAKRYATFARVNNNGISSIATIFKLNDYPQDVNGNTKLGDLIKFNPSTEIKFK